MRIAYKSMIPNNKPQWLINVQRAVSDVGDMMTLEGNERDYNNLKSFLDAAIESQRVRGHIRAESVKTEVRTDEGRTVIHVWRNNEVVQTYYIE